MNKAAIQLLILDVDGVLTDGRFFIDANGYEVKCFHTQDGLGIKNLQKSGITVAVITGRNSACVAARMKELNITHYFYGQENKQQAFDTVLQTLNLAPEQVAYMGDDLPDLAIMQQVGFSIAVNNAVPAVKKAADFCTQRAGGFGAVREACDYLLGDTA